MISGVYEALELRDGGSDYLGKGVSKVKFVTINFLLIMFYHIPLSNP
jgi:enolase